MTLRASSWRARRQQPGRLDRVDDLGRAARRPRAAAPRSWRLARPVRCTSPSPYAAATSASAGQRRRREPAADQPEPDQGAVVGGPGAEARRGSGRARVAGGWPCTGVLRGQGLVRGARGDLAAVAARASRSSDSGSTGAGRLPGSSSDPVAVVRRAPPVTHTAARQSRTLTGFPRLPRRAPRDVDWLGTLPTRRTRPRAPARGPPYTRPTMTWNRPVPLIGDRTSAAERAADVGGLGVPRARPARRCTTWSPRGATSAASGPTRSTRRCCDRVLAAAHAAPSVGHSQPWRFVVVSEPATRERAARMADEQRLRQAAPARARRGPAAARPAARGHPRGAAGRRRRLRPAYARGRRAGPRDLPRRRPVVVRLRHPEPLAGRPRRGARAWAG